MNFKVIRGELGNKPKEFQPVRLFSRNWQGSYCDDRKYSKVSLSLFLFNPVATNAHLSAHITYFSKVKLSDVANAMLLCCRPNRGISGLTMSLNDQISVN